MQRRSPRRQVRLRQGEHTPERSTVWMVPYGPVRVGIVGPKTATQGVPIAAARCMGPESFVTRQSMRARSAQECGMSNSPQWLRMGTPASR